MQSSSSCWIFKQEAARLLGVGGRQFDECYRPRLTAGDERRKGRRPVFRRVAVESLKPQPRQRTFEEEFELFELFLALQVPDGRPARRVG